MMTIRNTVAFLLLLVAPVALPSVTYGQPTDSRTGTSDPKAEQVQVPPAPEQNSTQGGAEAAALRAQLETMRHYDDKLLNTVYFTLYAILTIFIAVIGLGWYANFRVYKRDIDGFRQEIGAHLAEELPKLRDTLQRELDSRQKKSNEKSDKLIAFATDLSAKAIERADGTVERAREMYENRIDVLEFDVAELDAKRWESEKVYTNALRSYVRRIELAQKLRWGQSILSVLRNMERVLGLALGQHRRSFMLADQPLIDPETVMGIVKVLDALPSEYRREARELYSQLGVYRPSDSLSLPRFDISAPVLGAPSVLSPPEDSKSD